MRRIRFALVARFAVFCALPLLLALVGPDPGHAQVPRQRNISPDLTLSIIGKEYDVRESARWRSGYEIFGPFCVKNVGDLSSQSTMLRVFHKSSNDPVREISVAPLEPGQQDCRELTFPAPIDWLGTTQSFLGIVDAVAASDPIGWNNEDPFDVRVRELRPPMPDLDLTIVSKYLADPSAGPLVVIFEVRNFGARPAGPTRVEIKDQGGNVLGKSYPIAAVAADRWPVEGRIAIPVQAAWFGEIRHFTGIVDPDSATGDIIRANNVVPFSFRFATIATYGEGFAEGTAAAAAIATLIALVWWGARKRAGNAPPVAKPAVRGRGRHDPGTQSIRPGSDDVVLPSLRLRPLPDVGAQWIAFEDGKSGR